MRTAFCHVEYRRRLKRQGSEQKRGMSNNEIEEEKARGSREQKRRNRKQDMAKAKQWQGQKKTMTIKGRRNGRKTERRKEKRKVKCG